MTRPTEVFISYAEVDRGFVERLSAVLQGASIPHWYARKDVRGAAQWHDEIGAALERCDWFLLILSPEAVGRQWVKEELLFARNDERYINRVVPVMYRPCNPKLLSWTLPQKQSVDFTGDFEDGCRGLLRI